MAADKDFQEFSLLIYEFTGRIQATKNGQFLINYFKHKNTPEETNKLLNDLGYNNQREFNVYLSNIYLLKLSVQSRFSELNSLTDANSIIELAARKVAIEKEFSKAVQYPTSWCWGALVAQLALCQQGVCNPIFHQNDPYFDYNDCMDVCWGIAITGSAGCFLFAD